MPTRLLTGSTASVGVSSVSVEVNAQLPPVGSVATDTVPVTCVADTWPESRPDNRA